MNSLNSENKQHYKMYKKGKVWLFSSILSFTIFTGLALVNVNADDNSSQKEAVDVNTDDKNNTPKPTALTTDGQYSSSDNGSTCKCDSNNSAVKVLYDYNGNLKYFNENDGTQAKGNIVNVNNQNYYFDKDSWRWT